MEIFVPVGGERIGYFPWEGKKSKAYYLGRWKVLTLDFLHS